MALAVERCGLGRLTVHGEKPCLLQNHIKQCILIEVLRIKVLWDHFVESKYLQLLVSGYWQIPMEKVNYFFIYCHFPIFTYLLHQIAYMREDVMPQRLDWSN